MASQNSRSRLIVRKARLADIPSINRIVQRAYPKMDDYSFDELRGQINNFPEGQLVAVYADQVVGYCATICLPEAQVMRNHSWAEITGNGYGSTHDIDGDYLYGYEVCVDPDARGLRIGRRLYREREALAVKLGLKGIVFAGPHPRPAPPVQAVRQRPGLCRGRGRQDDPRSGAVVPARAGLRTARRDAELSAGRPRFHGLRRPPALA